MTPATDTQIRYLLNQLRFTSGDVFYTALMSPAWNRYVFMSAPMPEKHTYIARYCKDNAVDISELVRAVEDSSICGSVVEIFVRINAAEPVYVRVVVIEPGSYLIVVINAAAKLSMDQAFVNNRIQEIRAFLTASPLHTD